MATDPAHRRQGLHLAVERGRRRTGPRQRQDRAGRTDHLQLADRVLRLGRGRRRAGEEGRGRPERRRVPDRRCRQDRRADRIRRALAGGSRRAGLRRLQDLLDPSGQVEFRQYLVGAAGHLAERRRGAGRGRPRHPAAPHRKLFLAHGLHGKLVGRHFRELPETGHRRPADHRRLREPAGGIPRRQCRLCRADPLEDPGDLSRADHLCLASADLADPATASGWPRR